jgi:endonuclease/exonuclease/phosphatase family metal-dependent hydrolase
MFSNLEAILETNKFNSHYFSPAFNFTYQGKPVNHGNAILSRFSLEDCETHFINGEGPEPLNPYEREPNIRNLQIAKVKLDGIDLAVSNHHGYWHENPLGDEISVERMRLVADYLKALSSPIILTGDFNLKSGSPAMNVFNNFLEDLNVRFDVKNTLSPLRKLGPIDCDHVFISPEIKVLDYRIRDELVSDHKALVLDFDLSTA